MRIRFCSLTAFALCSLVAVPMLVATGCHQEALPPDWASLHPVMQQPWQDHVNEYTHGWLSPEQSIQVHFNHPVVKEAQLNKPLDGIVKVSPAQEVVAVFTADNILEVSHPEPFPLDKTVKITLSPDFLLNLPGGMTPLSWHARVWPIQEETPSQRSYRINCYAGPILRFGCL